MVVTKVVYSEVDRRSDKYPIARCFVVIDDCLKLNSIAIFEGERGRYLVLPGSDKSGISKSGVLEDTRKEYSNKGSLGKNSWEEYFHPVDRDFFNRFTKIILDGLDIFENSGNCSYRPMVEVK